MRKVRTRLLWERKAFLNGATVIIGVDEAGRGPLAGPVVAAAVIFELSGSKRFIHSRPQRRSLWSDYTQRHSRTILGNFKGQTARRQWPLNIPPKEAQAVSIFPKFFHRIDDSKKLTPRQRKRAYDEILQKCLFSVGVKSEGDIDRKSIHTATLEAMKEAVTKLIRKYCRRNKSQNITRENICVLVDGKFRPDIPFRVIPVLRGDSKSFSIAAASIIAKVTRDRMMDLYDKKYPGYGFARHKGYGTKFHFDAIRQFGPCPIHRKSFAPIRKK